LKLAVLKAAEFQLWMSAVDSHAFPMGQRYKREGSWRSKDCFLLPLVNGDNFRYVWNLTEHILSVFLLKKGFFRHLFVLQKDVASLGYAQTRYCSLDVNMSRL